MKAVRHTLVDMNGCRTSGFLSLITSCLIFRNLPAHLEIRFAFTHLKTKGLKHKDLLPRSVERTNTVVV